MPNPFSINVITSAGAALIAQATAANQIVFVAALSKASAATDAASLAGQPVSWYDGHVGSIVSASAEGTVARITVSFPATGTRQPLKSVCLTARLASQTDEQAVPVAALSDDASTIILPGADDVGQAVSVPFNIAIDPQQQSVEVTPGASASLADLSRFVSLHKAGDPTAGEAQTILGAKTFAGKFTASQDVSVLGDLDVLYNATFAGAVQAFNDVSVGGTLSAGTATAGQVQCLDPNSTVATLTKTGLDIRSASNLLRPLTGVTASGIQLHNDVTGDLTFSVSATTGTLTAQSLAGLITSLYDVNAGVGSLAEIFLINTSGSTARDIPRGTEVYDGIVQSGDTITATLDGGALTGYWTLLNKAVVGASGVKVLAVRTA